MKNNDLWCYSYVKYSLSTKEENQNWHNTKSWSLHEILLHHIYICTSTVFLSVILMEFSIPWQVFVLRRLVESRIADELGEWSICNYEVIFSNILWCFVFLVYRLYNWQSSPIIIWMKTIPLPLSLYIYIERERKRERARESEWHYHLRPYKIREWTPCQT